jgi:orotidine-5'-phosphate decarboxylase
VPPQSKTQSFADRLTQAVGEKGSPVCVGIDPRLDILPAPILDAAQDEHGRTMDAAIAALKSYCFGLIDVVAPFVAVVKPQAAFFESFGPKGFGLLWEVTRYAKRKGLLVIGDVKRGDIATTAAAYADAYLGATRMFGRLENMWDFDAITINPFFGTDGVEPFVDLALENGKGVFVLVKTSNPSSVELQDLKANGKEMYMHLAELVKKWAKEVPTESGYCAVGVVVGATFPEELKALRKLLPKQIFLVPGLGAQAAFVQDVTHAFNKDGKGAIIAVSRTIDFAYLKEPYKSSYGEDNWQEAVRAALVSLNEKIFLALSSETP